MPTTITIGAPVRGADFFDREILQEELWQTVAKGSALLAAPRRVGKTSLMHRMRDYPREEYRGHIFYLEAEGYAGPEDLVADLAFQGSQSLPRLRRYIRRVTSGVKSIQEIGLWQFKAKMRSGQGSDWKIHGENIIHELMAHDSRCLLMIDELSILLAQLSKNPEKKSQAVEVLQWLRSLRQQFPGRLSMVLGSSIGIGRIASSLGVTRTLNDLQQVEVGPFDQDTARRFAIALLESRGLKIDEETVDTILDQVGTYIPMFIQILVAALASEVRSRGDQPSPDLVRWCYKNHVQGPGYRQHFDDYYERIDNYYPADESLAIKNLLGHLATAGAQTSYKALYNVYAADMGDATDAESFDRLLTNLQDDFYITVSGPDKMVEFRHRWLKDWWRQYHAFGH